MASFGAGLGLAPGSLRGRHRRSLREAGVALGGINVYFAWALSDIDAHFVWRQE